MKNLWKEFWDSGPSALESRARELGFTPEGARRLVDLKLRFAYGYYDDDGGPAPSGDCRHHTGERP